MIKVNCVLVGLLLTIGSVLSIRFYDKDSFYFPNQIFARESRQLISEKQCPLGYELRYNSEFKKYECVCKKYHLYWPKDGLCYREYQQGPCPEGHRLVRDESTRQPICTCPFFSAKYENDGKCYQEYTRGPCAKGKIFMMDQNTGLGVCRCNPNLKMYYHEQTDACYELYSQGPCKIGHILFFNYATFKPECKCREGYSLYEDGNCYQLNTQGPCEKEMFNCTGTPCYMKSLESVDIQCTCLPKNSMTQDHRCYQPFTKGPCQIGEWLVFNKDGSSQCERKEHCQRFDNWHWWKPHHRCYKQFSQGPCESGKLFYLDPETRETGCHCMNEWKAYYWPNTNECFEQESVGPCSQGKYFSFNATSKRTECNCFKNYVLNADDDTCVELYIRGKYCPKGEIVTDNGNGNTMKCECGPHLKKYYWPLDGKCYPHYEQGPCSTGEQFRLHPRKKQRPACIVWGQTYHSKGY